MGICTIVLASWCFFSVPIGMIVARTISIGTHAERVAASVGELA